MAHKQVTIPIDHHGRKAWLKRHGGGRRRLRLAALGGVARRLRVPALLPAPRHGAEAARQTELRRLEILRAAGLTVPEVLEAGPGYIILSHQGRPLAARLRDGDVDPDTRALLLQDAAGAIARAHDAGMYLGQPLARNITLDDEGRVAFIDFEEDPGEVMGLDEAQVRDWLLFAYGCARRLPAGAPELAAALQTGLAAARPAVGAGLADAVERLRFIERLPSWMGAGTIRLKSALAALKSALTGAGLRVLPWVLAVDWLHDGDLDTLRWLFGG